MTPSSMEPLTWSRNRWWIWVTLIFLVQLGLIFWLGEQTPIRSRQPRTAPCLRFVEGTRSDLLSLQDPTLLALPHANGFSGPAWLQPLPPTNILFLGFAALQPLPQDTAPLDWSEAPRWLPLPNVQLDGASHRLPKQNQAFSQILPPLPEPELTLPEQARETAPPAQTTLQVQGELASRPLLSPLALCAWPQSDLLTNTVVQVLADPEGNPVSVTLLVSSGLKEADGHALAEARRARFEPLPESRSAPSRLAQLMWGQLIFQWQTLASTNAP